jgi:hypothetical protein
MHVHFSVPFTLLANYIRPGRDLSSAVKNKGIERGGIKTRESFELSIQAIEQKLRSARTGNSLFNPKSFYLS